MERPPGLRSGVVMCVQCQYSVQSQPAVYTQHVHNTDISVGLRVLTGVHHPPPSPDTSRLLGIKTSYTYIFSVRVF